MTEMKSADGTGRGDRKMLRDTAEKGEKRDCRQKPKIARTDPISKSKKKSCNVEDRKILG